VIGLAIQGKEIDQKRLLELLKDKDDRVQGAAALLASRTVKRDDPRAAAILPLAVEDLKSTNAWTRMNMVSALANLSPLGSVPSAKILIDGYKAEKEERLRPVYLAALKVVTGVEAKDLAPYEEWLKKPTPPPAPKEPAPAPATTPPAPPPAAPPAPTPKG